MSDILLTSDLLDRVCARVSFPVERKELVFFGIRGAVPTRGSFGAFASEHPLRNSEIDYQSMRCTLGQWHPDQGQIAVFLGSTVPQGSLVLNARPSGKGVNMLMPGRHEHQRGTHKANDKKGNGHRAFRQARFAPVQRSRNDGRFDTLDEIDFGTGSGDFIWDNIHSAYSENPGHFSSAGCQVICGLPRSSSRQMQPETGPWKHFVETAYGPLFGAQVSYSYLLFTIEEIAEAASIKPAQLSQQVCYGSSGATALQIQQALVQSGMAPGLVCDGDFGRNSMMALVAFQRRHFPRGMVTGVCGTQTAAALGVVMPSLSQAVSPPPAPRLDPATVGIADHLDETDLDTIEAQSLNQLFRQSRQPIPNSAASAASFTTSDPQTGMETSMTSAAPQNIPDPATKIQPADLALWLAQIAAASPTQRRTQISDLILGRAPLTPVNAALGPMIGHLLDGKKTVIGIVASIIIAIIGSSQPGGWLGDLAARGPDMLDGATGKILPVSLGMAVWGILGKIEKMFLHTQDRAAKALTALTSFRSSDVG